MMKNYASPHPPRPFITLHSTPRLRTYRLLDCIIKMMKITNIRSLALPNFSILLHMVLERHNRETLHHQTQCLCLRFKSHFSLSLSLDGNERICSVLMNCEREIKETQRRVL
jgi:hypothetical protein